MASNKPRSVADIQADIARSREKMVTALGDFVEEMQPKNIARRGFEEAKAFVAEDIKAVRAQFKDDYGWRMDRVLAVGGAVLGIVVFVVTLKSIADHRSVEARVRRALEARA